MTQKHLCADEVNGALWNAVATTDPKFTKEVSFGRKYTAIDAYYKIKKLTDLFGPCGIGWGWDRPEFSIQGPDFNLVSCEVTLWYKRDGEVGRIPGIGTARFCDKNGKTDDDAFKKALTDALTKIASYLGVSADVFMGRFDDSKYVDETRQLFGEEIKIPKNEQISSGDPRVVRKMHYGTIKERMTDLQIDAGAMKRILPFKFGQGKQSVKDLTDNELEDLVALMQDWKTTPMKLDALLDELSLVEPQHV